MGLRFLRSRGIGRGFAWSFVIMYFRFWPVLSQYSSRMAHFALRDRHRTVKCEACHRESLYREKTPTQCSACHRKDDEHKGALGDKCESCHGKESK